MPVDRSKLPNAFQFVTVVGARARQLLDGCAPKVDVSVNKPARIAEREVMAGAVAAVDDAAAPEVAPAEAAVVDKP